MSIDDGIYAGVPHWDQARVRNARVLVVGAGALGNEVLKNLALLNVQRLVIMDFDRVESSNLSRSVLLRQSDADSGRPKAEAVADRLLEINPELQILTLLGDVVTDLSLGLLAQVDVVIGCVDNRLARLYLNRWAWRAGKPWVDGGILNLSGQVAAYVPGHSCYECGLSAAAWKEIRTRLGCTDMARRYALDGHAPTTPIAASIIGAMQVQEALKLVMGQQAQSLAGQMFSYEGAHLHAAAYATRGLQAGCESHFAVAEAVQAPLSSRSTLGELWAYLKDVLHLEELWLELDHSVATRLAAVVGDFAVDVVLPVQQLSDRLAAEMGEGRALGVPKGALLAGLSPGRLPDGLPLWALGIPAGHTLRVGRGGDRQHLALAADYASFGFGLGVRALENPWWNIAADDIRSFARMQ